MLALLYISGVYSVDVMCFGLFLFLPVSSFSVCTLNIPSLVVFHFTAMATAALLAR